MKTTKSGTWESDKWQKYIEPTLANQKIRLAYN